MDTKLTILLIILGAIGPLVALLPSYVYYSYINELKECACATDYRQIYVKYAMIGVFIFSILMSLVNYYFTKTKLSIYVQIAVSLSLSGLLLSYAYSLIKKDCKCSESWKRTFMLVHGVIISLLNLLVIYKLK